MLVIIAILVFLILLTLIRPETRAKLAHSLFGFTSSGGFVIAILLVILAVAWIATGGK